MVVHNVTIRLAEETDVAAVAFLTDAAYASSAPAQSGPGPLVLETYGLRIERGQVWLLRQRCELVGVMVLELHPAYALIYSLAIAPAHQGKGHGGRMLRWADERARGAGLDEVRLYTSGSPDRPQTLYAAYGYREVCRRPNPYKPGWTVVDMVKRLDMA